MGSVFLLETMMIRRLFEHFDTKTSLWISVNDIKRKIVEGGVSDEILFHFVDINERRVLGYLHRTGSIRGVYGTDNTFQSHIYIARSLDISWRRVAAVKELLHIVDTEDYSVSSEEAVDDLLEKMAISPEIREWNEPYLNDKARLISAVAILAPKRCREILRELNRKRVLDIPSIARLAQVPERFIPVLLSDNFEHGIEAIHEATDGPARRLANGD